MQGGGGGPAVSSCDDGVQGVGVGPAVSSCDGDVQGGGGGSAGLPPEDEGGEADRLHHPLPPAICQ